MDSKPCPAPSGEIQEPVAAVSPGKPRPIKIAVTLLIFQCLLMATTFFRVYGAMKERASFTSSIFLLLIALGAGLAYAIWERQNWARITLVVLLLNKFVFGMLSFWAKMPSLQIWDNVIYLAGLTSHVAAVVLLYTEAARNWFAGGPTADYRSSKQLTATSGLRE